MPEQQELERLLFGRDQTTATSASTVEGIKIIEEISPKIVDGLPTKRTSEGTQQRFLGSNRGIQLMLVEDGSKIWLRYRQPQLSLCCRYAGDYNNATLQQHMRFKSHATHLQIRARSGIWKCRGWIK